MCDVQLPRLENVTITRSSNVRRPINAFHCRSAWTANATVVTVVMVRSYTSVLISNLVTSDGQITNRISFLHLKSRCLKIWMFDRWKIQITVTKDQLWNYLQSPIVLKYDTLSHMLWKPGTTGATSGGLMLNRISTVTFSNLV